MLEGFYCPKTMSAADVPRTNVVLRTNVILPYYNRTMYNRTTYNRTTTES